MDLRATDDLFIKCRECNVLRGCKTTTAIKQCLECSKEQYVICNEFAKPLGMSNGRVRSHVCMICQERHDALLPLSKHSSDNFSVPGHSARFN